MSRSGEDFFRRRQPALDAARGIAILGMAAVHLVSDEADPRNAYEGFWGLFQLFCVGKASATFSVLAGFAWSLQVHREGGLTPAFLRYYARRILGLTAIGLAFSLSYWNGQILTYFALYMACCLPLLRARTRTVIAAIALVLVATPVLELAFGRYTEPDWAGDVYGHKNAWDLGWGSLRYLFFNGEHPVIPWLVYPLAGILLGRVDWSVPGRARRLFEIALPVAIAVNLYGVALIFDEALLGDWRPYLGLSWRPATLLFAIHGLSSALSLIGLLFWVQQVCAGLPRVLRSLEPVGRLALTHYLLHVFVAFVPLDPAYA